MCGIVGLFAKDPGIEAQLGAHLAVMLASLSDRGPDSAGFAVYVQLNSRALSGAVVGELQLHVSRDRHLISHCSAWRRLVR